MIDTRPLFALRVHDRAGVVPFPEPDQHNDLVDDIAARGVQVPLDILADGTVLDGRTRLSIARALGLAEVPVRVVETDDPVGYMVRMALLRRHLTTGQRKALAATLLRQEPERSDRSVAKVVGIHHETVAAVRSGLEDAGQLAETASRTGIDGRIRALPEPRSVPTDLVALVDHEATDAEVDAFLAAVGAQPSDRSDVAAFAARDRALTPQMREAEATAAASAEWHRAWSAVLRVTGGLDPEAVLPRMAPEEHITVRAAIRSMREWLDRADQAMRTDGLRAIQGGRS